MRIVFILLFLHVTFWAIAQNDTAVFNKQQAVTTSEYVFYVPAQWKKAEQIDISSKDRKFDFSGVGLSTEFNHAPVTATFTLRRYECPKISVAEDYVTNEITSYPDRVTEAGHNYATDTLRILSGEKATLYSTRFFRRTKLANFSRFDMVVYSTKRKTAYMFTVTVQYRDPTYAFEADNKLKQYAIAVFKTVLLR
jgi:hypothetical protein